MKWLMCGNQVCSSHASYVIMIIDLVIYSFICFIAMMGNGITGTFMLLGDLFGDKPMIPESAYRTDYGSLDSCRSYAPANV